MSPGHHVRASSSIVRSLFRHLSHLSALYLLNQKSRRLYWNRSSPYQHISLFAVFSSALGATVTNFATTSVVGISRYGKYGPIFTLLLVGLIGHAILRHRLMNIRFVIRRGVVYLTACVASGLASSPGFSSVWRLSFQGRHISHSPRYSLHLLLQCCFTPLKERIRGQCERYLYREPYDYQQIVRDTSRLLGGTIELYELLELLGTPSIEALKSNGIAVYILDEDEVGFVVAWCSRPQGFPSHTSLRPTSDHHDGEDSLSIFRDDSLNSMPPEQRHRVGLRAR